MSISVRRNEYQDRLTRLQQHLAQAGVDAALLTDAGNIAYFTGYMPQHFFLTRSRMLALVVPASGEPTVVVPSSHRRDVEEETGLRRLVVYDDLRHAPVEDIGAVLDRARVRRLGLELGFEQRVNMTVADLDRLRRRGGSEVVDVTDAIWRLRTVKSAAELALIERACRIGEEALDRCVPGIRAGDTERAVAGRLAAEVALLGGHVAFLIMTSGTGQYHRSNGAPRERALQQGDLMYIDLGVRYAGYHADFNRNVVVGHPAAEQVALQEMVRAVTECAGRYLVAGTTATDAYGHILDECRAAGLAISSAGRIGHGLGLDATEPPHLSALDTTPLVEGLVTTVEPMVERIDGLYCAECIYAVAPGGARRLNRGGSPLQVAGEWADTAR